MAQTFLMCISNSLLVIVLGLSVLLGSQSRLAPNTSSAAFVAPGALSQDADAITSANWQQHPKIKAVRSIVESINTGLKRAALKISIRRFEYCEPYIDTLRKLAVDSKGVPRLYEKQAGSDDSSLTWQHYYDDAGRLRFVFITGGAVNGSQLEHRIYFDDGGKRIWEDHKYVKGPGYTFPEVWPDEQLQGSDARAAFSAKSTCPEKKRG
jgi:hypothetical protein